MGEQSGDQFLEIGFSDFLDLVKVLKMLYGREIAERFLTRGMSEVYNIDIARLLDKKGL